MIKTHDLPQAAFDQIADGYGDADSVRALLSGQISRRQIALRAILDGSRTRIAEEYFALLVSAQERDPASVERAFREPHFGAWIFSVLRRMRGVWPGTVIAADMAYLGLIAASAAFSAGLEFQLDVATDDGCAFIPGMGLASGLAPTVAVVSFGGRLTVGNVLVEDGAPGWHAARRLQTSAGGRPLTVTLEDADPVRDCHRLGATDGVTDEEAKRWQRLLDGAWRILVREHPRHADGIGAGLMSLVPLRAPHSSHGVNATSMDAFGAISLTMPSDEHALAASILHEFQHAKLGGLLDLVPLYSEHHDLDEDRDRLYAPWRDDPRPLGGLFQGVYAFMGVTDFYRAQRRYQGGRRARFAEFEFARWRERVWRSYEVLISSSRLTPYGRKFLDRMRDVQRPWQEEPVADEVAVAAREAAEDHWIGWRLRNLSPDATAVASLAEQWRNNAPPPSLTVAVTTLPSDGRALVYNPRVDLTALSITNPARFAELRADPAAFKLEAPYASAGDIAFVAGDYAGAEAEFVQQIRRHPDRYEPWVGLALAKRRTDRQSVSALFACPEVVLAVFRAQAVVDRGLADPVALAQWLRRIVPAGGPSAAV